MAAHISHLTSPVGAGRLLKQDFKMAEDVLSVGSEAPRYLILFMIG